ncbi:MAG TPA: SsrA-binding protein [Alphaproteobacteria bacterium]|jgi:SsrA-binding protein|nr:SsrA-binding protein [Alphaproteobacteria bacterium]HBF99121.1 SsrA-binding protein [Alphaproteobacteria bacterium]
MAGKNRGKKAKGDATGRLLAENRKARYNYQIEETVEAGVALTGSEVKSLREGRANIAESYASEEGNEIWLINAYIPPYSHAGRYNNHEPRRKRKLLLHRRQIGKLAGLRQKEGMTLIPLRLYFNDRGMAKLALGLARGKKMHDKRETEKKRDWDRQKARLLRDRG